MKESLNDLLAAMQAIHSPLVDQLQQGLPLQSIQEIIKPFAITFPEELYDFYSWKNGLVEDPNRVRKLGELRLMNLGIFLSLKEAKNLYEVGAMKIWGEGLFPIFESGGGDYYFIDLKAQFETTSMIYYYSPSDPNFQGAISMYDSLQLTAKSLWILHLKVDILGAGDKFFIGRKNSPLQN